MRKLRCKIKLKQWLYTFESGNCSILIGTDLSVSVGARKSAMSG